MPSDIALFCTALRAPFNHACVSRWHDDVQAHSQLQTQISRFSADTVALSALKAQTRLCQTSVFSRLDQLCAPEHAPQVIEAALFSRQSSVYDADSRSVIGAGAALMGAALVFVGQVVVSVLWLGISMPLHLMTAIYRAVSAEPTVQRASPAGAASLPPATQQAGPQPTSGPVARRVKTVRAQGAADVATRPFERHRRAARPSFYRAWRAPEAAVLLLQREVASGTGGTLARQFWVRALTAQSLALQMRLILAPPSFEPGTVDRWAQRLSGAVAFAPSLAHLGLGRQGHWRAGLLRLNWQDFRRLMATGMSAGAQDRLAKARASLAAPPVGKSAFTRSFDIEVSRPSWREDASLSGHYVRERRITLEGLPTVSACDVKGGLGSSFPQTFGVLWRSFSAKPKAGSDEAPNLAIARRSRPQDRLVAWLRSPSERASSLSLAGPRAQELDGSFVQVLQPTAAWAKTSIGPRLLDEGLGAFLQRLRDDARADSLYPGGETAFVATVQSLYARDGDCDYQRGAPAASPLGLHPQFIKDLPRQAVFVFAQGDETPLGEAFEINTRLQPHWNQALSAQDNVAACAGQLSPWLDSIASEDSGILLEDVTLEATQAGLAAACEAVQRAVMPGLLVTPMHQKSAEFVVWPDANDGRVHIVAVAQYGSLMVIDPQSGEGTTDTPLYPFCLHVHLSVGPRQRGAPRDIVIHEGNFSRVAPW